MTGERGRGGGWVVAQFALLTLVVVALALGPRWPDPTRVALVAAGVALLVAGAALVVWAARALGPALTPYPEPAAAARLVETGPFAVVRHPIYTGALVVCCGLCLAASPAGLVPTAALAVLWAGKAASEEQRLRSRFPDYDAYARRVRFRLVPGVF